MILPGVLAITDLVLNGNELSCNSTGRPVESVTWRKNGEVIDLRSNTFSFRQVVDDPTLASYFHILSSEDPDNFVGNFTCELMNNEGRTVTRSLTINGMSWDTINLL